MASLVKALGARLEVGTCAICMEEMRSESSPPVQGQCDHPTQKICVDCLRRHVSEEMNQKGQVISIRCPIPGCRKVMTYEDIRRAASAADFARFDRLVLNRFLQSQQEFRWCMASASCGSGQLHEGGDAAPIMTCHKCKGKTCFTHSVPWHTDLTCAAYEEDRQRGETANQDFLRRETKPCPECGAAIQKNDGCDHMTCKPPGGCGHEFCWRCLAPYAKILRRGNHHHQPTCIYYAEFASDGEDDGGEE
eukprot:RCo006828